MVTGLTESAVQLFIIGHFTQIKLYVLELNRNVLLLRIYVTDGSLQRMVLYVSGGKVKVVVQGAVSP